MSSPSNVDVAAERVARKKQPSALVMQRALKAPVEAEFTFMNLVRFHTVKGHILPSVCRHKEEGEGGCPVCHFEKDLQLPSLPEMIFDQNLLEIRVPPTAERPLISFNAFDALRLVDHSQLPNVMVNASEKWQRANGHALPTISSPFDWTFTSEYGGTVGEGVRVEETSERIDLEKLKRPDPLLFYDAIQLYEDELADNGTGEMEVKVRAMPTNFFVLCRFYLRVDQVMVRVFDCRLYSELHPLITDAAQIWQHLPIVEQKAHKLFYPSA
ncbi:TIP41-like protein [Aphelenchoides fujianensis]|nr:TIP41-like protein [Aphelenchoides fujianensis]